MHFGTFTNLPTIRQVHIENLCLGPIGVDRMTIHVYVPVSEHAELASIFFLLHKLFFFTRRDKFNINAWEKLSLTRQHNSTAAHTRGSCR